MKQSRVKSAQNGQFKRRLLHAAMMSAFSGAAVANPTGPTVVNGAVSFNQQGNTLAITNSPNAIINWQSFSISGNETTRFLQQSAASSVLNRVTGIDPSLILGTLQSNGRVFLVNPSGIIFGAGSRVDVAGLVASTLNLNNQDFLAGRLNFTDGALAGGIRNQGVISTPAGGSVILVAPQIDNSGIINAPNGDVILAAGRSVRLGDTAAPNVLVEIQAPDTHAVNVGDIVVGGGNASIYAGLINQRGIVKADTPVLGENGKVTFRATKSLNLEARSITSASGGAQGGSVSLEAPVLYQLGAVHADGATGGSVSIRAGGLLQAGAITADGAQGKGGDIAVNAGAVIQTQSALLSARGATAGGSIVVNAAANDNGLLFSSGSFLATGTQGGDIKLLGHDIVLLGARANASGSAGGGTILVGGDYQGNNPAVPNADSTWINYSTSLRADAGTTGTGGKVIVWADSDTRFAGHISARGGATSGDGGFIEVSGKDNLIFAGTADASAPKGTPGTVLLDPKNIIIDSTAGGLSVFQLLDPHPDANAQFGQHIAVLPSENVLVTDPNDGFGGISAGAVYLFDGSTGALISALTGSANDSVGNLGVTVLSNGNYVVSNRNWNGNAGAVTWGSGTAGVSGAVSSANSLVGGTGGDAVGSGGVVQLSNGNYLVFSPSWTNGGIGEHVGAVTWGSSTTGVSGVVSAANSLVGSVESDSVGSGGVIQLSINGNYLLLSPNWTNGGAGINVGAVTWGSGTAGVSGELSAANSLVGSVANDAIGSGGITHLLATGNYLVKSPDWNDNTGAVTWGSGTTGASGVVSATNSLVGSTPGDAIGSGGTIELTTGNYLVLSPNWTNGGTGNSVGALTWGSGTAGVSGVVSSTNTLVGSVTGDAIGGGGILFLSNGNYVVSSPNHGLGAVTWGSGATGISGVVSATNSLVGSTTGDSIGSGGMNQLSTTGNYLVVSPSWTNDGTGTNVGAVTWGSGTAGVTGVVSATNSLVGSATGDSIGSGGITELIATGNYLVLTPTWTNGGAGANVGAVSWGSGATGVSGVVSSANSLVGSTPGDAIGSVAVTQLVVTGNYLVHSPSWTNGGTGTNVGAVTWGSGTTGVSGVVSAANSLVGSTTNDAIGSGGITELLTTGNYLVLTPSWTNDGAGTNVGAVTWGSGTAGVSGVVSAANSLVGSTPGDAIGSNGFIELSSGNYLVPSPNWTNGTAALAGAVTFGDGTTGVSGAVSAANSLVGSAAGDVVGGSGIYILASGNYVVMSPNWTNAGAGANVGAATWGSATVGVTGEVSAANSLVGGTPGDSVGSDGIVKLDATGNYLVLSPNWTNGGAGTSVGAVTWGSGTAGVSGVMSAANSLVGSTTGDRIGSQGITQLAATGNYVVSSPNWNGDTGAVTWGSGTTGISGVVSATNSLVGGTPGDGIGVGGIHELTVTGNYLVFSFNWTNGGTGNSVGAVTWGSGTAGVSGVVSATNSLVGSVTGDVIGGGGILFLPNGNYVVGSPNHGVGAVTWGSGTAGVSGVVSAANSLVGSTTGDELGSGGMILLFPTSNYLVSSPHWNGDSGAVTWGSGTAGVTGVVSSTNSLVGSNTGDLVGTGLGDAVGGITVLSNGNYLVTSPVWNGQAGAVTWGSGATGISGVVSATNSLVGSTAGDVVGAFGGITPLSNGNYLVSSGMWTNGGTGTNVGAVTWGSGVAGVSGVVSAANSLVGNTTDDAVGSGGILELSSQHYLVFSPNWSNGAAALAGAITVGSSDGGVSGAVSAANSVVGTTANDQLGSGGIFPLSSDRFVVSSPVADNGALADAGLVHIVVPNAVASGQIFASNAAGSVTITPAAITAITNDGTAVTLQANNDITLNPASDVVTSAGGGGGAITLQAGRSILLSSSITTDNGNLIITANHPGADPANRDAGAGGITMTPGTTLNAGAGSVTLTVGAGVPGAASGDLVVDNIASVNVTLQQNGNTDGSSILRAAASSLIQATNLTLKVTGLALGGSIGTVANPMLTSGVTNLVTSVSGLGDTAVSNTNGAGGPALVVASIDSRGGNIRFINDTDIDVATAPSCDCTRGIDSQGGNIYLQSTQGSIASSDSILASAVSFSSAAFPNGGSIELIAAQNIDFTGPIRSSGYTQTTNDTKQVGKGGNITIQAGGSIDLASVSAIGGQAAPTSKFPEGASGDGGSITIVGLGAVRVGAIEATGAPGYAGVGTGFNRSSGGAGGTIQITGNTVNVSSFPNLFDGEGTLSGVTATGGAGGAGDGSFASAGPGGHGGTITISGEATPGSSITVEGGITVDASGGTAGTGSILSGLPGGSGGSITLNNAAVINVDGTLSSTGGSALSTGNGGDGGTITIAASVSIGGTGSLFVTGGDSSTNTFDVSGGRGGNVNLQAVQGAVDFGGDIDASGGTGFNAFGGAGGGISVQAGGSINLGAVSALGGVGVPGGAGGTASVAAGGAVTIDSIAMDGGFGQTGNGDDRLSGAGGVGGNITITAGPSVAIGGIISADGGGGGADCCGRSGQDGGAGGIVSVTGTSVTFVTGSSLSARGGIGGGASDSQGIGGAGGHGGAIAISGDTTAASAISLQTETFLDASGGGPGRNNFGDGGTGGTGGSITLNKVGAINLVGDLIANGGSDGESTSGSGGSGGAIDLAALGSITGTGNLFANGRDGGSLSIPGGHGGTINLSAGQAIDLTGAIDANGGIGSAGGSIGIQAGGTVNLALLSAFGGNGTRTDGPGGAGGSVNISGSGTFSIGQVAVYGGDGAGDGDTNIDGGAGGAGGSVAILAIGAAGAAMENLHLFASGGQGGAGSEQNGAGGAGGSVTIARMAAGNLSVSGFVSVAGGAAGPATTVNNGTGGDAGTVFIGAVSVPLLQHVNAGTAGSLTLRGLTVDAGGGPGFSNGTQGAVFLQSGDGGMTQTKPLAFNTTDLRVETSGTVTLDNQNNVIAGVWGGIGGDLSLTSLGAVRLGLANPLNFGGPGPLIVGGNLKVQSIAGSGRFVDECALDSCVWFTDGITAGGNIELYADELNDSGPITTGALDANHFRWAPWSENLDLAIDTIEPDNHFTPHIQLGNPAGPTWGTITVGGAAGASVEPGNFTSITRSFEIYAHRVDIDAQIGATNAVPVSFIVQALGDINIGTVGSVLPTTMRLADGQSLTLTADADASGAGNLVIGRQTGGLTNLSIDYATAPGTMTLVGQNIALLGSTSVVVNGPGAQDITAGNGLFLINNSAGALAVNSQGSQHLRAGTAGILLDAIGGSINVTGGGQFVGSVFEPSGTQTIFVDGPSAASLVVRGGLGAATIVGGNQTITAGTGANTGSILIQGGTQAGATAGITNYAGPQTVSTTGQLQIIAGSAPDQGQGNFRCNLQACANLGNESLTGNQSITAVGGISILGGSGGARNEANIYSRTNQTVDAAGGITLTAGSGAGPGNWASLADVGGTGSAQNITFGAAGITIRSDNVGGNDSTANIYAGGSQAISGTGDINLIGGTAGFMSWSHIEAGTDQSISARAISILALAGAGSTGFYADNGAQHITTTGGPSGVAGAYGLALTNLGALGTDQGGFTSAAHITSRNGSQTIDVSGSRGILISGVGGLAVIDNEGTAQTINVAGAGELNILSGGGSAQVFFANGSAQSISAGSITLSGGTADKALALIEARNGTQHITTTGGLTLIGGTATGPAIPDLANPPTDCGAVSACAVVIADAGAQTINANSISITGGPSGSENLATIRGNAGQDITVGAGGLVMQGGGGAGVRNFAFIENYADDQILRFAAGAPLTLTGGTVGIKHFAAIIGSADTTSQQILGNPVITLTGGASGGGDGSGFFQTFTGNNAYIGPDPDGPVATSQTVQAQSIVLQGGFGANNAAIDNFRTGGQQTITVVGDVRLLGGNGASALAELLAFGDQSVQAGSIQLVGAPGGAIARISTQGGNQTIATSGSGPNGWGLELTNNGASQVFIEATGAQHITATNGGGILLDAAGGNVDFFGGGQYVNNVFVQNGTQTILVDGSGINAFVHRGGLGTARIDGAGQSITAGTGSNAGSIVVQGGAGNGGNAFIFNQAGTQTIAASGQITVTAGTGTSTSQGLFACGPSACALIGNLAAGGDPSVISQTITAGGGLVIAGGSAGSYNEASVFTNGSQLVHAAGGIHALGGAGTGNYASLATNGAGYGQTIDFGSGNLSVIGGSSGGRSFAAVYSGGGQSISGQGDIIISGGVLPNAGLPATQNTPNGQVTDPVVYSWAEIVGNGGQDAAAVQQITARSISITARPGQSSTGIFTPGAAQHITTTGSAANGYGLTIENLGATGTDQNNAPASAYIYDRNGTQSIDVANSGGVLLKGTGGLAFLGTNGPAQTIDIHGSGTNALDLLAGAGGANLYFGNATAQTNQGQSITAGSLSLTGGTQNGAYASIDAANGNQTVTLTGALSLQGGTALGPANAGPDTPPSSTTSNSAGVSLLSRHGKQTITAASISLTGGGGGSENFANILSNGGQDFTIGAGGLTLTGGTGTGVHNYAMIENYGGDQIIRMAAGSALNITAGVIGVRNFAGIWGGGPNSYTNDIAGVPDLISTSGTTSQQILGHANIAISGGATGGGGDGTESNVARRGNTGFLIAQIGPQHIDAGTISVTAGGGAGENSAVIATFDAGAPQTIDATGAISLTGGSALFASAEITSGGAQTISARGITAAGGSASGLDGQDNPIGNAFARVLANGTQSITITGGGAVTLAGGTNSTGGGAASNSAEISSADGFDQTIAFQAGGAISLTGGSSGSANDALIGAGHNQTIDGTATVTIAGGAGNSSQASINNDQGAVQTLHFGSLSLAGGSGADASASIAGGVSQVITVTGATSLTGGTGNGAGAIIGTGTNDIAIDLTTGSLALQAGTGAVFANGSAAVAAIGAVKSTVTSGLPNATVTISSSGDVTLNGATSSTSQPVLAVIGTDTALGAGGAVDISAGGNIVQGSNALIRGSSIALAASGSVSQAASEAISVDSLDVRAGSGIALLGNNLLNHLTAHNQTSGDIVIHIQHPLVAPIANAVLHDVVNAGGNVNLTIDTGAYGMTSGAAYSASGSFNVSQTEMFGATVTSNGAKFGGVSIIGGMNTLNTGVTQIDNLTLSSTVSPATLGGASTLTINDQFAWYGGTLASTGGVTTSNVVPNTFPNAVTSILRLNPNLPNPAVDAVLDTNWTNLNTLGGVQLNGSGGGNFIINAGRTFTNQGNFFIVATVPSTATSAAITGAGTFLNRGSLIHSAAGLTHDIRVPLVNDVGGTISVTAGTLNVASLTQSGGSIGAGVLNVADAFNWASGSIAAGAAVNVAGTAALSAPAGGPQTLDGNLTLNGTTSLTDTTLGGAGTLVNTGGLTLQNGTIGANLVNQGTLVVPAIGTATINGALTQTGAIQVNASTFQPASLTVANGFTNDGTIVLQGGNNGSAATLTVTNGTLTNSAGHTIASITAGPNLNPNQLAAQVVNLGAIDVQHNLGVTNLGRTFDSANGTLTIAAGQTLAVANGVTRIGGSTISGASAGTLDLQGTSTLDLAGDVTLPASGWKLGLSNGTVTIDSTAGTLPVTLTNQGTLTLSSDTITANVALDNQGTLAVAATGTATINGALTQSGTIQVTASTFQPALLTVANGFTNDGTIVLQAGNNGLAATLTVTNGTLTNSAGHTIASTKAGPNLNPNQLAAQVVNLGSIDVQHNLGVTNLGRTFDSANGTLTIAAGQTLAVANGVTRIGGSTISGASAGTLDLQGTSTLDLAGAVTLPASGWKLGLSNGTVTIDSTAGTLPATLTNQGTLTLSNDTITANVALDNQGTLAVAANTTGRIDGPLMQTGAIVLAASLFGPSVLTVANGFTNDGAISLVGAQNGYWGALAVTNGTLVNSPGHTIASTSTGPNLNPNRLDAQVTNRGSIDVQHNLSVANAINGIPRVFNQEDGEIAIAAGTNLGIVGGTFNWTGGVLSGAGNLNLSGGANIVAGGVGVRRLDHIALSVDGLNVNSTLDIESGTLSVNGPISVGPGGQLNINGGFTRTSGQAFNNDGTIGITTGTIVLDGNGSGAGSYNLGPNAALDFSAGTYTLGTVSGAGSVSVSGGTANVAVYNIPGTTNISGGALNITGPGNLGALNISSGSLSGNGSVTVGTLNLAGGSLDGTGNLSVTGNFIPGAGTVGGGYQSLSLTHQGDFNVQSYSAHGNLALAAANGSLMIRDANLDAPSVSLSGSNVMVQPSGSNGSRINAASSLTISTPGTLMVDGSNGEARIDSAGTISIRAAAVNVKGGNFAAKIDPTSLDLAVTNDIVLTGGSASNTPAVLAGNNVTLSATNVILTGGAGDGSYAAIEGLGGNTTVTARNTIIMNPGTGLNADASIVGRSGPVTLNAASCTGCVSLGFDPLGNTATDQGVFGAPVVFNIGTANIPIDPSIIYAAGISGDGGQGNTDYSISATDEEKPGSSDSEPGSSGSDQRPPDTKDTDSGNKPIRTIPACP